MKMARTPLGDRRFDSINYHRLFNPTATVKLINVILSVCVCVCCLFGRACGAFDQQVSERWASEGPITQITTLCY